jgi:hypothetical protein
MGYRRGCPLTGTVFAAEEVGGFGVIDDFFFFRVGVEDSSGAGGNIGKVTKAGGEMAFFDDGVGGLAVFGAIQKVAVVKL